jgi:hypothetical protein
MVPIWILKDQADLKMRGATLALLCSLAVWAGIALIAAGIIMLPAENELELGAKVAILTLVSAVIMTMGLYPYTWESNYDRLCKRLGVTRAEFTTLSPANRIKFAEREFEKLAKAWVNSNMERAYNPLYPETRQLEYETRELDRLLQSFRLIPKRNLQDFLARRSFV